MISSTQKSSRRWPIYLAIAVVAAAGYGGWRHYSVQVAAQQAADAAKVKSAVVKIPVTYANVTKADYAVHTYGLGTVSPFKTVTLRSRVDGEITKVLFKQGEMVKQGDPLSRFL
jgi:multidrug efflux system membrane fusion protein